MNLSSSPSISIEPLVTATDSELADLAQLLPQLSQTAAFDPSRITAMLDHDGVDLLVARDGDRIVGMATLVTFPLPTGVRGLVEDVVVDESMRGRGVARFMLEAITRLARERRLRTVDLTSRPSREAALRLYESVGFERRETNVLRYIPSEPAPE